MAVEIEQLRPGVRVTCAGQWSGVVVFNATLGLFSEAFPREQWSFAGPGFMVRYDEVGLVFEQEPDDLAIAPADA